MAKQESELGLGGWPLGLPVQATPRAAELPPSSALLLSLSSKTRESSILENSSSGFPCFILSAKFLRVCSKSQCVYMGRGITATHLFSPDGFYHGEERLNVSPSIYALQIVVI